MHTWTLAVNRHYNNIKNCCYSCTEKRYIKQCRKHCIKFFCVIFNLTYLPYTIVINTKCCKWYKPVKVCIEGFYEDEIKIRKLFNYTPFNNMLSVVISGKNIFKSLTSVLANALSLISFIESLLFKPLFFFHISKMEVSKIPQHFLFHNLHVTRKIESVATIAANISSAPSLP